MTVFTCEDNFDAMMTCVYEAWASRLGHSNIKLKTEPIGNLELFCDYRHVDADPEKTACRYIRFFIHAFRIFAYSHLQMCIIPIFFIATRDVS